MINKTLKSSLFIIILFITFFYSHAQFIFTIAGTGVAGYSGDGNLATKTQLAGPDFITKDKNDNIYFTDGNCVRKINASDDKIYTIAGTGAAGYNGDGIDAKTALLNKPQGIAVNKNGDIYIVDQYNQRVRKIDALTGLISTIAGNGVPGYNGDEIPATEAELAYPVGMALDTAGNIYIADQVNNRIRKITISDGIIHTIAGGGTNGLGDGGLATNASLSTPLGIAIDKWGNIYISDSQNFRIRKINASDGIINTIAGNGSYGYSGDGGPAKNASIAIIFSVAVDTSGNIYLPDFVNGPLRMINAKDSTISTIAGGHDQYQYNGEGIPAIDQGFQPSTVYADENSNIFIVTAAARIEEIIAPSTNFNTLSGIVFIDYNNNGIKDADEPFFKNAEVKSVKAGIDSVIYLHPDTSFSLGVDTGAYITSVHPYYPYYTITPSSVSTSHAAYQNTDSLSFALHPIANKPDLKINMFPTDISIVGDSIAYKIKYENFGTTTFSSGTIKLVKDARMSFVSSVPANSSAAGDTIEWNYSDFKPLDTASILVNFILAKPPVLNANDTLKSVATITPAAGNIDPSDDTSVVSAVAFASYDPNIKSESHAGVLTKAEGNNGEWLTYAIYFQNTGTYKAFNITVKDTLSDKLDWSTLQMVSASNNYKLHIDKGNIGTWYFENINLPDSFVSKSGSHGYIIYRIKSKKSLVPGTKIYNSAGIYFDYNLAVQTNTEQTTILNSLLPVTLINFTAKNSGKFNELNWQTTQEINAASFMVQHSYDSRLFNTIGTVQALGNSDITQAYGYIDADPTQGVNYYRLKIIDKDGAFVYSKIISVNNGNENFNATILPNPVHDFISLQLTSNTTQKIQVELVDMNGKSLSLNEFEIAKGVSTKNINIQNFSKGFYLLKIISASSGQIGLKVIKE